MATTKLFLIAGIPATGKTTYGNDLAAQFRFAHHDIEHAATINRLLINPMAFIEELKQHSKHIVATWGFNPEHQASVSAVLEFKKSGFRMIWLDGNRPAALRKFIRRGTVPEICFYLQMYRIEVTGIIDTIKPIVINPFDTQEQFKSTAALLEKINQSN